MEFLRIRRVPLLEKQCADDAPDVVPQVTSIFSKSNLEDDDRAKNPD